MAIVAQYSRVSPYPVGDAQYVNLSVFHDSERSPRVNGKLVLRPNPWSLNVMNARCTNWHLGGPAPIVYPKWFATSNMSVILRARAIAESDLRGKLARKIKSHNVGSLGVSIAQSGQAIALMRGSSASLISIFSAAEQFYRTTRGKKRLKRFRRLINKGAKPLASEVLAGFFGWAPLIGDFSSAMKTLANPWPARSFVSSKERYKRLSGSFIERDPSESYLWQSRWSATGHSSYSCAVEVSNPNIWVANKLGLVDPFRVGWDLIPWSFLVNMVSNMSQVSGSLTDFAGLALSNTSLTTRLDLLETVSASYEDPRPNAQSGASGTRTDVIRSREVGVTPPSVTPYMRFPEWNVGLAAITGSLLIQQVGRLSKVLGF